MQSILIVIHTLVAVGLIGLVLLHHGKGADMGAAFGSGASQTVFGSQGSGSFLSRVIAGLAAIFFVTCLALSYSASRAFKQQRAMNSQAGIAQQIEQQSQPGHSSSAPKEQ